jgi:hypothetical protein
MLYFATCFEIKDECCKAFFADGTFLNLFLDHGSTNTGVLTMFTNDTSEDFRVNLQKHDGLIMILAEEFEILFSDLVLPSVGQYLKG